MRTFREGSVSRRRPTDGYIATVTSAPLLLLSLASLLGCAPRIRNVELPAVVPADFSMSGEETLEAAWWSTFDDARLDALVDEALTDNLDLKVAWARLAAAQAVERRTSASLFPSLQGTAEAQTQLTSSGDSASQFFGDPFVLGLAAEYEVDLWGRIRSAARADGFRVEASLADYKAAALSLSAEVAGAWFRAIESREQLALAQEQVEANEQMLQLLDSRYEAGQIRGVDVVRQRQLVEATRALEITARAERQVAEHRLAVLLGRPPLDAPSTDDATLPVPAQLPATGLPAELLQRRPDVRQAHNLLLAADRDMAVAITERYPRITLSATGGTEGATASDLFETWFVTLAANLVAPIFEGGQRKAEVQRTRAVKHQRLYAWGQTSLDALREVEDALARDQEQQARLESLQTQSALAQQAYERLQVDYINGISNYIDVLTALTNAQRLNRELLATRRARLEARVALYRALAGGIDAEETQ